MYLRLADKRLGLLINFHVALIKEGIALIINSLQDDRAKSPSRKGYFASLPLRFQGAPWFIYTDPLNTKRLLLHGNSSLPRPASYAHVANMQTRLAQNE